jgi:SMI1 / KNR4 family.
MLISKYGSGSTELVSEFERSLGIELDEDYRTFLVKYNGGETPDTHVGIRGCSTDLRYLFGINTAMNIEDNLQIPVWENKQYLPIGMDYFGNFFVIGLSDDNKGKVFFCDHEKGFAVKQIADSFKLFLCKCKSEEIDPCTKIPPEEREASMIAEGRADDISDALREIWRNEYEKYVNMVQEKVVL